MKAWAIANDANGGLCWTSAPKMIGGGTVWQIYKTEAEARKFCTEIVFADATYHVVVVEIAEPPK